jgi:myo-inositol-1(or 4)-monophosphatase
MTTASSPDLTTAEGLEEVLSVTREVAREAAALVSTGFRKSPSVEHKGAVDLVTSFDRESEALVRRRLGNAFPFTVIGEETGSTERGGNVAFYVDPLDGTTNFVHGHPFWCVSIGLVVAGQPVLGVVISPPLGLEWFGWLTPSGKHRAVRRSAPLATAARGMVEEPCVVSQRTVFGESLLATGFPYDRRTNPEESNFEAFVAIKLRCQAVRRCGSAALDLCLVADGTYDGYWERKLGPWDIAAGSAIVRAAGGRVTDFEGTSRFIETGQVIATNGAIHGTLRTELDQVHSSGRPPA